MRLDGRVALVTGGSKGIGAALAEGLSEAGATVIISARNEAELRAALDRVCDEGRRPGGFIVADLSQPGEPERLARTATAMFGRVDILVNNAGISRPETILALSGGMYDATLNTNLNAALWLTKALAPQMRDRHWGRIINISSIFGSGGWEQRTAYCVSKHGLNAATQVHALELGPSGITVNSLAPGPFATDMVQRSFTKTARDSIVAKVPLGRMGDPDELAPLCVVLASDAGSFINGAVLYVDGGWKARA